MEFCRSERCVFGAGALPAQRSLYASVCARACVSVWTAGELKNIIEWRECLAGQCARRPGAEPKMTSNALWPLLIKCENGKIAGKALFVPAERKKMRLWGRRQKEQTRRTEWNYMGHFERNFQVNSSARQVLCAHPTPYTKNECFGGERISKVSDGDEVGWTQKPFRCSHMKPFLNAVWRTVNV